MAGKKRLEIISSRVIRILSFVECETQKIRVKLISELEDLFKHAVMMARSAENREDWMRIASYIAQTINSLAKSFDETRFNEDLQRLRDLIEAAKKRAGEAGAGAPVT